MGDFECEYSGKQSFGTILKNNPRVYDQSKKYITRTTGEKIDIVVPRQFNGPLVWKDYISRIQNQGNCGNCWAHSSTAVLSDRFALQTLGQMKPVLCAHQMTICEYEKDLDWYELNSTGTQTYSATKGHTEGACNGLSQYNAADFLYTYGTCDCSCVSCPSYEIFAEKNGFKKLKNYTNPLGLPTCEQLLGPDYDVCLDDKTALRRYRSLGTYNISSDEKSIMHEIYRFGPVIAGYLVYEDFMKFDGKGIYTHPDPSSKQVGGHSVAIYGWGEEHAKGKGVTKYWIIRNSWGKTYGNEGFFKMKRGMKDIQLEENVIAIIPDIPYLCLKCTVKDYHLIHSALADQKRIAFGVDNLTGYRYITIGKIKQGVLKGELVPLIKENQLPDYNKFIAGKVGIIEMSEFIKASENKSKTKRGLLFIYSFIIILLLIFVIASYWYAHRKKT